MAQIYEADAEYEARTVVKLGGERNYTNIPQIPMYLVLYPPTLTYLMNSDASGLPSITGKSSVKVIGKIAKGERLVASDEPEWLGH